MAKKRKHQTTKEYEGKAAGNETLSDFRECQW